MRLRNRSNRVSNALRGLHPQFGGRLVAADLDEARRVRRRWRDPATYRSYKSITDTPQTRSDASAAE